jgi:hypothetical protein
VFEVNQVCTGTEAQCDQGRFSHHCSQIISLYLEIGGATVILARLLTQGRVRTNCHGRGLYIYPNMASHGIKHLPVCDHAPRTSIPCNRESVAKICDNQLLWSCIVALSHCPLAEGERGGSRIVSVRKMFEE